MKYSEAAFVLLVQLEDVRIIERLEHKPYKGNQLTGFLSDSRPEDRRFRLFDAHGELIADLTFTEYHPALRSIADTPWGDLAIAQDGGYLRNAKRGRLKVSLGGLEMVVMELGLRRLKLRFADGILMNFRLGSEYHWLTYEEEHGKITVFHDKPYRDGLPLWRITKSGILPAREREIFAGLIALTCQDELDYEDFAGMDG